MKTGSDILIIGGGIIGLAIAIELRQRGSSVTVLTRDTREAATQAAAGMLAPQAETLPDGPFRELGLKSLSLYPNWIQTLEKTSGLSAGYWPCGILAPQYNAPADASSPTNGTRPSPLSATRQWLDAQTLHQVQSGLDPNLPGAWWFPEEGQVDPRRLATVLQTVATKLGVDIQEGITVESFQQSHGRITAVQTSHGNQQAEHYVLATGAWSSALLPIPLHPLKGQMLAVRGTSTLSPSSPKPGELSPHPPLSQVLFGPDTYIVPRKNGRIVIGATSESVGFTPHNTPAGLQSLLNRAIQLYPALKDYPIEEQWWGFRPTTPDHLPILGPSHCENLTLATGHHRNGILLAPVTALLITEHILDSTSSPLLTAFHWQRFRSLGSRSSTPPTSSESTPIVGSAQGLLPSLAATAPEDSAAQPSVVVPTPSTPSHSNALSNAMQTLSNPFHSTSDFGVSDSPLTIAGRTFRSRLMTGTGKYRNFDEMRQSVAASQCEIVTVAVRRVQTNAPGHEGLAEALDWTKVWMLPNTAGCKTAEDAIRVARLGREMAKLLGQEDNNFVKLEVIPDAKYLLPDPIGTLEAAEQLVKEGFAVLPYINADPLLAKRLEEAGCATVMPLGSPIGSGQGIRNAANIQIIIENTNIPVVVDAGIGTPSEAAQAMEMGADALLINTAIAQASQPASMGRAMGLAAEAGRLAYLAGRIPVKAYASASSPLTGTITGS